MTQPAAFAGPHGYFSIEGDRLVAYDLIRGEQRWLVSAAVTTTPLPTDGRIFIVQADSIAALSDEDGGEVWKTPFAEAVASPPAFGDGWLILATVSGAVVALRAADGETVWRHDMGARASARPALTADRVYVPLADRRIVSLDLKTGEVRWTRRLGGEPNEILALADRIYGGADDNFFYCLDAGTGQLEWRWRTGGDVIGRAVADERRVYFVALDNMLRALDRKGGSQLWKRGLPMRPRGGPLLTGETLIVSGLSQTLRAYSARTGAPLGEFALASEPVSPVHAIPNEPAPFVIAVTGDILKGATVISFTRENEPRVLPIAALPNPTMP